jgi:4-nitrophenyl phosphatase
MIPLTIKALVLDMDGVLWTENNPIGDLPEIFQNISERSLKVALATNNSTRTPRQYIERLKNFGVDDLQDWQILTSSLVVSNKLLSMFPEKGDIFVIGENGLISALEDAGFHVVDEDHTEKAIAVAVGIDRGISFNKLRRATLLIRKGLPFLGTNPDKTFPTPEGLILGTGALLAALSTATDVDPKIMGKPSPDMIAMARQRLGTFPQETLVIGDRLETDIASGQADGSLTALVLSGVTSIEALGSWLPAPDYCTKDLAALLEIL